MRRRANSGFIADAGGPHFDSGPVFVDAGPCTFTNATAQLMERQERGSTCSEVPPAMVPNNNTGATGDVSLESQACVCR